MARAQIRQALAADRFDQDFAAGRETCDTLLDTLAPSPADDIAILMAQMP